MPFFPYISNTGERSVRRAPLYTGFYTIRACACINPIEGYALKGKIKEVKTEKRQKTFSCHNSRLVAVNFTDSRSR
jgi:hypothetical protein